MDEKFQIDVKDVIEQIRNLRIFSDLLLNSTLIADDGFISLLGPIAPRLNIVRKQFFKTGAFFRPNTVLLCLTEDDASFRRKLSGESSARILDFWRDCVLPMSVAQLKQSAGHIPASRPTMTYSILTQPRSGSTFLAHRMDAAGLGRPREHLRSYISAILERRLVDTENVSRWWEGLSSVDQAGGLFGTKIIFQFYSRFIRALDGTSWRAAPSHSRRQGHSD